MMTNDACTLPPTPLNSILSRLTEATESLARANERLAGASGRLGTASPDRDERKGEACARPANPGFIGTANEQIDDLFGLVERTAALAEVFCEAV